ncbi:cytochrome P460 family protein [Sulfidibacter corallicola]|uniref:Cytochrome P460 family protein n=1 Tax=Sulfidibacter corallicola TaxID=2818388 RepID=A0A8A4THX9_SULCO|nr:cytochrome P460 family protein [Sulfidibacter corallicola]QTD48431.1 cytochrome P460 family protein [Sulfidibacter corallicola]
MRWHVAIIRPRCAMALGTGLALTWLLGWSLLSGEIQEPAEGPLPVNDLLAQSSSRFAAPKDTDLARLVEGYRTDWERVSGLVFSGMHWQQSVVVYVNRASDVYRHNRQAYLEEFQRAGEDEDDPESAPTYRTYPRGTVILKEAFRIADGQSATPLNLSLMVKREAGFDSALGDWEFIQIAAEGDLIIRGTSENPASRALCTDCHLNMKHRDFVYHTAGGP